MCWEEENGVGASNFLRSEDMDIAFIINVWKDISEKCNGKMQTMRQGQNQLQRAANIVSALC